MFSRLEVIDPSAPSTGTAGWGNTPDERHRQVGQNDPAASSPDAKGPGDLRHTAYPQNEAAQNPAARANTNSSHSLRCSDALHEQGCDWSVTGGGEEELFGYMRSHARAAHGKSEFTSRELENTRRAILKRAA